MSILNLMVYRDLSTDEILGNIDSIIREKGRDVDSVSKDNMRAIFFKSMNKLLEVASSYGFQGNIWRTYIVYLLVNDENAYSRSCEMTGFIDGSINEIVHHDFNIIMEYLGYNFGELGEYLGIGDISFIYDYSNTSSTKKLYNGRISERILNLTKDLSNTDSSNEFKGILTEFYREYGVGKLGLHKAFRISHDVRLGNDLNIGIEQITNTTNVNLDDLVLYEIPKQQLIANTRAFVEGKKANNCLLFGDAGTGKSSCVKAILNEYYDQGLRMIEVYKHQFQYLNNIISQIKNRNYRFIIYMDDLSFEDFETEYKYLKAVIEGGLEKKPDNVLIYATSNRRHLIREEVGDKVGIREDLHASDTVQEKLSLSARFGESIFFNGPSPDEFKEIVKVLAKRNGIILEESDLLLQANKWEMSHSGRSGRTAQQFIDHLLGSS